MRARRLVTRSEHQSAHHTPHWVSWWNPTTFPSALTQLGAPDYCGVSIWTIA